MSLRLKLRHEIQLGGSGRFSVGLTSRGLAELSVAGGAGAHAIAVLGNVRSTHEPTVAVVRDIVGGLDCFSRVSADSEIIRSFLEVDCGGSNLNVV